MNFEEIKNAIKHLIKTSQCNHCERKYLSKNISIIATTKLEGLFEMKCTNCDGSTIVSVFLSPEIEVKEGEGYTRTHQAISKNDILDMKNFLNKFDGNFKKIFIKE